MNSYIHHVEPEKVLKTIAENLGELKAGRDSARFSKADKIAILADFDLLEIQALKAKLAGRLVILSRTHPDLYPRDVLRRMLTLMPVHLNSSDLIDLSKFVHNTWERMLTKVAA